VIDDLPKPPENAADWADIVAMTLALLLFLFAEIRLIRERRRQADEAMMEQAKRVSAWLEPRLVETRPDHTADAQDLYGIDLVISNANDTPIWDVRIDAGPKSLDEYGVDIEPLTTRNDPTGKVFRMIGPGQSVRVWMRAVSDFEPIAHGLHGEPWPIRFKDNAGRDWIRTHSGNLLTISDHVSWPRKAAGFVLLVLVVPFVLPTAFIKQWLEDRKKKKKQNAAS
jgi:hypothetical protein